MLITYIQREYLSALVESCTVIMKLPMICVNMLAWPCNSSHTNPPAYIRCHTTGLVPRPETTNVQNCLHSTPPNEPTSYSALNIRGMLVSQLKDSTFVGITVDFKLMH